MRLVFLALSGLFLAACSDAAEPPAKDKPSHETPDGGPFTGGSELSVPCGFFLGGAVRDIPWVKGTHQALKWIEIEPTAGTFDLAKLQKQAQLIVGGRHLAIRMTGAEPTHVVSDAADTWTWIDPNTAHDECPPPNGCERPVPWDAAVQTRYESMVHAIAETVVTIDGVSQALSEHPGLESVMLTLPGWGRIRELGFEIEDLPGYTRQKLIAATQAQLRAQATEFPGKPVFTQFFLIDDGADPPLWEAMRDAILDDPTLDAVGFYEENLAHGFEDGTEVFRPKVDIGAPLATSKDQTFTGFQALTSWADPSPSYADAVAGGSPAAALQWAFETYGSRYFELYAQDVDAAVDGTHPEWATDLADVATRVCEP